MSVVVPYTELSPVFNVNNFISSADSLKSVGNQIIYRGSLTTQSGGINDYGELNVYGETTLQNEPFISQTTTPGALADNQLVTKSYISSAVSSLIPTVLPIHFYYGRHYKSSNLNMTQGSVQIGCLDASCNMFTISLRVNYNIIQSSQNNIDVVNNITWSSLFQVSFYRNNTEAWTGSSYVLTEGDELHKAMPNPYGSTIPIVFGLYQNKPYINYSFPSNMNTAKTMGTWVSAYSVGMEIVSSTTGNIESDKHIAYFII